MHSKRRFLCGDPSESKKPLLLPLRSELIQSVSHTGSLSVHSVPRS